MSAIERARRHQRAAPPIGAAWAVLEARGRGHLVRLEPRNEATTLHLTGSAEDAVELAQARARRAAPLVLEPRLLFRRLELDARPVAVDAGYDHVDGGSIGLAALLAEVSAIIDRPVPAELVAVAALHGDGRTSPVHGWAGKLDRLRADLPHARVLCAPDDDLDGQTWPHVTRVGSAEEAVAVAWPEEALADAAAAHPAPGRLIDQLLAVALLGWSTERPWAGLARTARLLRPRLAWTAGADWLAAIAGRFAGDRVAPLPADDPWPDRTLDLDTRAHLLSHRLEHALGPDEALVDAALALLTAGAPGAAHDRRPPPPEPGGDDGAHAPAPSAGAAGDPRLPLLSRVACHAAERRLLGALGRHLVRIGRVDEALDHVLGPCRQGWVDALLAHESSISLSALLDGHARRGTLDPSLAAGWIRDLVDDPRTTPISFAFTRVAWGEALIRQGRHDGDPALVAQGAAVLRDGDPALDLPGGPLPVPDLAERARRALTDASP